MSQGDLQKPEETQPLYLLSPRPFASMGWEPGRPTPQAPPSWAWGAGPGLGTKPRRPQSRLGAELCLEQVPGLEMAPGRGGVGGGQRTLKAAPGWGGGH